jgi:hypothetical protein
MASQIFQLARKRPESPNLLLSRYPERELQFALLTPAFGRESARAAMLGRDAIEDFGDLSTSPPNESGLESPQ